MSASRRVDLLAVAAAALAAVMAAAYVVIMRQQGDDPLAWVLAVLVGGAVLAGYGARARSPHRKPSLWAAAALLTALGVLALLTIGLPIIVAGVLCLVAATRSTQRT